MESQRQKRSVKVPARYSEDEYDNNFAEHEAVMERLDSADMNNRMARIEMSTIPEAPDKMNLLAALGGEFLKAGFLKFEVQSCLHTYSQFSRCLLERKTKCSLFRAGQKHSSSLQMGADLKLLQHD